MSVANPRAGEDEIEASRAPLIEHLVELRSRLIKSLIAFLLMFFVCFGFSTQIYNILVLPYVWAAGNAANAQLIYTGPLELLFTHLKVAAFGAGFFAFPVLGPFHCNAAEDGTLGCIASQTATALSYCAVPGSW